LGSDSISELQRRARNAAEERGGRVRWARVVDDGNEVEEDGALELLDDIDEGMEPVSVVRLINNADVGVDDVVGERMSGSDALGKGAGEWLVGRWRWRRRLGRRWMP
jgi:hypothetical protein